jgi:hypothetical protein
MEQCAVWLGGWMRSTSTGMRLATLVVGMLVALTGVLAVLYLFREQPGERPYDDALAQFQASAAPTQVEGVPANGVYPATASGSASISFPPASQSYGAFVPVTVEALGDGCWRTSVDLNAVNRQSWDHCLAGGSITELGTIHTTRWDFGAATVENTTTMACEPPLLAVDLSATAGTSWSQYCTGTSTRVVGTTVSEGPYAFVGPETFNVGGQEVPCLHYRQTRATSGAQDGPTVIDFWFAADNGLMIRMDRDISIVADSPVGNIKYREQGTWSMTSLLPRT